MSGIIQSAMNMSDPCISTGTNFRDQDNVGIVNMIKCYTRQTSMGLTTFS